MVITEIWLVENISAESVQNVAYTGGGASSIVQ